MAIVRLNIRSQRTTKSKITGALGRRINRLFIGVRRNLTIKLKKEIRLIIEESAAYQSILFQALRGEFGLTRPKGAMDAIITQFVNGLKVNVKNPNIDGRTIKGRLNFAVEADWESLVSIDAAQQVRTEAIRAGIQQNANITGGDIDRLSLPWLRWLLLEGGDAVVQGFSISRQLGRGRSGLNYRMIETPSRNYRVNNRYRGTEDNNFITRELQAKSNILRKTMLTQFQREIKRVLQR